GRERGPHVERRGGAGAAGVLPFGLGRQAVGPARLLLLGKRRELRAELAGIAPAHLLGRVVRTAAVLRMEERRVLAHHVLELALRDRVGAQVERPRDGDLVLVFAGLALGFSGW